MRTSITFGGAGGTGEDWPDVVDYVREAERLGVDFAWSAEAWGQDAVTSVAWLAAVTSRIRLGTGIMQITARVPPPRLPRPPPAPPSDRGSCRPRPPSRR